MEPGAHLSFQLTRKRGAALVTKHRTYREDITHRAVFGLYTKEHYDSWIKFSLKHGSDIKPILVTGVDLTRDFAMIAYSDNNASLSSEFTISVPLAASVSASVWGTWRTEGLVHTNCGPQVCTPPTSTNMSVIPSTGSAQADPTRDGYNQCLFIRGYTMRKRVPGFPGLVLKGQAGPHDLGPGNNCDETFPELTVQSSSDPDTVPDGNGDPPADSSSPASSHESLLELVHNVPFVCHLSLPFDCWLLTPPDRRKGIPSILLQNISFE